MRALIPLISIFTLLLFTSNQSMAQWQIDHQYGMKINVPADWSKNSYKDGTDQVYEFYNAEGTVAITLRAFAADPSLSMDMLVQVFEQAMLPQGTQRQLYEDHTSYNGIPGKQAVYQLNQEGTLVSIVCFYAIQNGNAYVLSGIVPNQVMTQNEAEIKSVTQSFTINGFERKQAATTTKVLPKPPGQGTGARPQQTNAGARPQQNNTGARPSGSHQTNSGSVAGNYKFVSRSDGKVLTNYHYINITSYGTYEEKYEPKNSPGYEGGNKGTWKVNMGRLYLRYEGGQITDEYMIKGDELHRTSSNGVTFIFRRL